MSDDLSDEQKNVLLFSDEDEIVVDNNVHDNDDSQNDPPASDPPSGDPPAGDPPLSNEPAGNNTPDDDDLTDEELLKIANPTGTTKPAEEPTEFNNPVEIAGFLGFTFADKKPEEVKLVDIKAEIDRYKSLANDEAMPEIKMMKSWLIENKDKTPADFFASHVSPFESLLLMPNQSLFMWHRMNVAKKSQQEAEKEFDDLTFNNKLEEEMKTFRNVVEQKNQEFYSNQKAGYDKLLEEKQGKALKNRQELMEAITKDKSVLGGELKIKNVEIKEIYEDIVSGKIQKQLKDHNVMKEVAWFLKNKETLAKTLKGEGGNEAKLNLLNTLTNSKKNVVGKGDVPESKPVGAVDLDDWDF